MRLRGALLVLFLNISSAAQTDSLIISEIMFYPFSGNNEFIEIFNSGTDPIDLLNYKIKYYTSLPDSITGTGSGTILQPESYAVIMEGDYDFENGIYRNLIPSSALKLKITNGTFGSSGMANTTSRPVALLSPANDTLDQYFYSADNQASYSDEKKFLIRDTSSLYWTNSIISNGTPGFRNSVMQYSHDISLTEIKFFPLYPAAGQDLQMSIKIKNRGFIDALNTKAALYSDLNSDSIPQPDELLFSAEIEIISAGDSAIVNHVLSLQAGEYHLIASAEYPPDEDTLNNYIYKDLTVSQGIGEGRIVINEIMYAPKNNEPEWIELLNNSPDTINLKKWWIGDAVSSALITAGNKYVLPGGHIIIAKDSTIKNYYPFNFNFIKVFLPSLNNTGDAVLLYDSLLTLADSVYYLPSWGGGNNFSLERVNPLEWTLDSSNWKSSENRFRATPGFINSVVPKENDLTVSRFRVKEKYGVNGDYINLSAVITNKGSVVNEPFYFKSFHDMDSDSIPEVNEIITQILAGEIIPGDSLIFDFSFNGYAEGLNNFISTIGSADQDTCNNTAFTNIRGVFVDYGRNDIVINEIMYAPENEPEWFELVNKSASAIDLKNFRIADQSDTSYLTRNSYILNPGEYLVIAADSSLLLSREIPSSFIKCSFPPLNNSGDKLIIIDSLTRIIDSVKFFPEWGGRNGKSLERKDLYLFSADSLNWQSCSNKYNGTPGYINSVTEKPYDLAVDTVVCDPALPVKGDTVYLSVKAVNKGTAALEGIINFFIDQDNDSIPEFLVKSLPANIPAKDSINFPAIYCFHNIQQSKFVYAEIFTGEDQDTSNNYFYSNISMGYRRGSIVLNEVLYSPGSSECEWIELFNNSDDSINIEGWQIGDLLSVPGKTTIDSLFISLPYSYVVISNDSSLKNSHRIIPAPLVMSRIPNLNNDADGVVLYDNRDLVIDSMNYSGSNGNFSLEKISPAALSEVKQNWIYSYDIEMSTPGRINSITQKDYDLAAAGLNISPRFPCKGDSVFISLTLINRGSMNAANYKVQIFVRKLNDPGSEYLLAQISGQHLSAGDTAACNSDKYLVIEDALILRAEVQFEGDEDSFNNIIEKKVIPGERGGSIIVNEIMYDPAPDSPEWIEVYNNSGIPQNLKNWFISDILAVPVKSIISENDFYLDPGDYLVIASDSGIAHKYPGLRNFVTAKFGSLSSSSDGVIIYDYREGLIDSVRYISKWGGKNNRSLERISFMKSSWDSSNWTTSLSPEMATPGYKNSVSDVLPSPEKSVIINEIMYEPDIDNCEFVELFVTSQSSVNIGGWRLEDLNKNYFIICDTSCLVTGNSYFVFASDSIIKEKYSAGDSLLTWFSQERSLGLTNSGESILLKDLTGKTIDSVAYSGTYHDKYFLTTRNRSLERINHQLNSTDPLNWTTSRGISGATPWRENSVNINKNEPGKGVSIHPNPFSPDSDGREDFAMIEYSVNTAAPVIRIRIFDAYGRLVRTLDDNFPYANSGSVIFDGRDDQGRSLRIGIYILLLEAFGVNGSESYKYPFVIARKL